MPQNRKAAVIFVWNLRLPLKNAHFAPASHGVHLIILVHLKVGSPLPCWRAALIEGQPFSTGPHASHQEWQSAAQLLPGDRGPDMSEIESLLECLTLPILS